MGSCYHFFLFLAIYSSSLIRFLHCTLPSYFAPLISTSPTTAMASKLLIILFAAGIASASRDLADPSRFPPAYVYGIPPGFFGPSNPGGGGGAGGAGWGGAGGWGGGYGGPSGGYSRGGVEVPTVVCSDKGPCYGKKVACPKKCFWSYSRSGNGYGSGGGGGSCSIDCKTKCTATC